MNQIHGCNVLQYFRHVRLLLESVYEKNEARTLALIIFEHYTGFDLKKLITVHKAEITDFQRSEMAGAVQRLLAHEPVQHITGMALFYGNRFMVNNQVLIPRPETEELVRWIINDYEDADSFCLADIGTGSGCIAISLALNLHNAKISGFDVSPAALTTAIMNNQFNGANASFYLCDIFKPESWPSQYYDVIVSNPPYVPESEKKDLPLNVKLYDPPLALFVPDSDPLLFYKALAHFAVNRLHAEGWIYLEVHQMFADNVAALLSQSGFGNVIVKTDLNNRKRMVRATVSPHARAE